MWVVVVFSLHGLKVGGHFVLGALARARFPAAF